MAELNIMTKSVANPKTLVASICLLLAVALVLSTGIGALLPQSAQAVTSKSAHKACKKVAKSYA